MTSEDFIVDLRRNGVKLIKNDGSLIEIPPDFLKRATELCSQLRCSSITYRNIRINTIYTQFSP